MIIAEKAHKNINKLKNVWDDQMKCKYENLCKKTVDIRDFSKFKPSDIENITVLNTLINQYISRLCDNITTTISSVVTVLTPYFADEHLKFTDAHLYFAGAQLYFAGAQLYFAGAQLYFAGGHPTLPVDTLLCRWTPYFAGGHPTLPVDTLLCRCTPYFAGAHPTLPVHTLLCRCTPYFNCLIFN